MSAPRDEDPRSRSKTQRKVVPISQRVPPHDLDSEAAVLSAVLLGHDAVQQGRAHPLEACGDLRPQDFYSEAHRRIFEAVLALHAEGKPTDVVVVANWLKDRGRIAQVGGIQYLTDVLNAAPAIRNVGSYATAVREKARIRSLIATCQRVAAEGHLDYGEAQKFIEGAQTEIATIAGAAGSRGLLELVHRVDSSWLAEAPPARSFLATDTRTGKGALASRGVALLAAGGGLGKSFVVNALALAVASGGMFFGAFQVEKPGRVLIISGEDDFEEYRRRVFHVGAAVDLKSIDPRAIEFIDAHDQTLGLLDRDCDRTDHARDLGNYIQAHGPFALVVLDPIARFAGAASIDKDSNAGAALISTLEWFATKARGLVLGVHHTSLMARRNAIADATALRGTTAISDSGRMTMLLSSHTFKHGSKEANDRIGKIATLSCVKANYAGEWSPIDLRRGDHGELIPLDEVDREILAATKKKSDPKAKTEEREKELAEQRAKRAESVAAAKRSKDIDRELARRKRYEAEDAALLDALAKTAEGLSLRALRAELASRLGGCSHDACDVAIARNGAHLERVGAGSKALIRRRLLSSAVS